MQSFDVVIVGAGAAGLFCAGVAGQLGLKVLVLDHSEKVAEKIRISGGGRANFTNMDVTANNFLSDNPRFAKSALSRFTPADFVALVKKHGIAFHEKHKGQLFCDRSAEDLIAMLLAECAAGGVERWQPCGVKNVRFLASSPYGESASSYEIDSDRGTIHCGAVVIASGGLSIPKIGATDFIPPPAGAPVGAVGSQAASLLHAARRASAQYGAAHLPAGDCAKPAGALHWRGQCRQGKPAHRRSGLHPQVRLQPQ